MTIGWRSTDYKRKKGRKEDKRDKEAQTLSDGVGGNRPSIRHETPLYTAHPIWQFDRATGLVFRQLGVRLKHIRANTKIIFKYIWYAITNLKRTSAACAFWLSNPRWPRRLHQNPYARLSSAPESGSTPTSRMYKPTTPATTLYTLICTSRSELWCDHWTPARMPVAVHKKLAIALNKLHSLFTELQI